MCELKKKQCERCTNEAEYDSVVYGQLCEDCLDVARTDDLELRKKIAEKQSNQSKNDDRVVSLIEKQIILCRVAAPLYGDIVADLYRQEAAKSASADLKKGEDPPPIEIDVLEAINFSLGAAAQLMSRAGLPLKLVYGDKEKDTEQNDDAAARDSA